MLKNLTLALALSLPLSLFGQQTDTVIVNLAKTSKIIFTVEDPEDLDILKHYDFEKLFKDVLIKIEAKKRGNESANKNRRDSKEDIETDEAPEREETDEMPERREEDEYEERPEREEEAEHDEDHRRDDDDDDDDEYHSNWRGHHRWNRTWQTFNFDLGTNNYLQDGKFPSDNDAHAVRPWGSWYVGLASVQRSKLARKFFLEWGMGLSWYNFKFQDDNVMLVKDDNGVQFEYDTRDVHFQKSKLSVSYVYASLIPVLDFGDHGRKPRLWDRYDDHSFRLGFGPYIGYRISSHTKMVFSDDGREKDKDRDNYYLNNVRYGARLQIGYRSTDLFFNYDLSELFEENRGPKLNAFSFGVIF